jgi:hypothetical protein
MNKVANIQERPKANRASGQPVRDRFPAGAGQGGKLTCAPIKWLKMKDAANYCGLSKSSLYQAMADGRLKSVLVRQTGRIKGIRLISLEALETYIKSFGEKGGL